VAVIGPKHLKLKGCFNMRSVLLFLISLIFIGCQSKEVCHSNGIRRLGEMAALPNLGPDVSVSQRGTVLAAWQIGIAVEAHDHKISCSELEILEEALNIIKTIRSEEKPHAADF